MKGSFPLSLWCHFDNCGPRTTNHAEGWHNALNHSFGMPHPSICTFLNWLQKHQFEVQSRGIQLHAGRQPKPRSTVYVQLDERIQSAKIQLTLNVGSVFMNIMQLGQAQTFELITRPLESYMEYMAYLLVGK